MSTKITLSVAEYKTMLEKGVPIEFFRRAKNNFSWYHYTPDAPRNQETAEPDALYYSNFLREFLLCAVVPAAKTTLDLPPELDPLLMMSLSLT